MNEIEVLCTAWITDKGRFKSGVGFHCSGKQGRDQLHWSETKAKQLLQDLWLAIQAEHSFSTARKMLYCTLSQADAWQNKLNHSLPPLSTRTRLCSTSLDEISIQAVRERYPQPSIRDLSVQTPLWRITFALSPAAKALVFLFPPPSAELPWLELQTFQSYNDLLKPVLLRESSGKQKLC